MKEGYRHEMQHKQSGALVSVNDFGQSPPQVQLCRSLNGREMDIFETDATRNSTPGVIPLKVASWKKYWAAVHKVPGSRLGPGGCFPDGEGKKKKGSCPCVQH